LIFHPMIASLLSLLLAFGPPPLESNKGRFEASRSPFVVFKRLKEMKVGDTFPEFRFFTASYLCRYKEVQFRVIPQIAEHDLARNAVRAFDSLNEQMILSFESYVHSASLSQ
jgi:hypothetical protein